MAVINKTFVDQAKVKLAQGDVSGAYAILALGGDPYAKSGSALTAEDPSFLGRVVEKYWDRVYGTEARQQKWDIVAQTHLTNYIREIERRPDSVPGKYRLPDTLFIEDSYAGALEVNGLSKDGAIDLAINQITQPLTISLNDYIDKYLPGKSKAGLDVTIDMPDWHSILGKIYGDLGDRVVPNSTNFTTGSWEKALFDLGIAGITGTMEYVLNKTAAGNLPEWVLDHLKGFTPNAIYELAKDYEWAFDNKQAVLDQLKNDLQNMAKDYGWAWNNPGAVGNELINALPNWAKGLQDIFHQGETSASPLVLDLDGDGIELTDVNGAGAVYFDIDNDGIKEATGWVKGGDGLLVLDRNNNGKIDSQSELFGDTATAANGFLNLKSLDSNADGKMTSADAQWNQMRVWIDANGDALSQASELKTFSSLGITDINLNYTDTNYVLSGNTIKQDGTFTINGQVRKIVDAWFNYNPMNSEDDRAYTPDSRVFFLPNLRGYGNLPDLHIAMSRDPALLQKVQAYVGKYDLQGFFKESAITELKGILYQWAGVTNVNTTSRGTNIDARDVGFLEAITGERFQDNTGIVNPGPASFLKIAMDKGIQSIASTMMFFSTSSLFKSDLTYNATKGAFEGPVSLDLNTVHTEITKSAIGSDRILATANLVAFLNENLLTSSISSAERTQFDALLKADLPSNLISLSLLEKYKIGMLSGTSGNDLLIGEATTNASMYGGAGNDTLIGLAGNDNLIGGIGDDTYYYEMGHGFDIVSDESGNDVIVMGPGFTKGDLTYQPLKSDIIVSFKGVQTFNLLNALAVNYGVETFKFSDGSTFTLPTSFNFTINGTAGNDVLYGSGKSLDVINGLAGDDTIYGLDSDDTLNGGAGVDIIYGGNQNDTITGGIGNDTLYGEVGNDTYLYNSGDGLDTIINNSGVDTIKIGTGYTKADLTFQKSGNNLLVFLKGTQVFILQNHFSTGQGIDSIKFSDGTSYVLTGMPLIINGTSSADSLAGSDKSNDLITGFGGNDYLTGGAGDDTYYYEAGHGFDTIYDSAGNDVIIMGAGFTKNDLTYQKSGMDLIVSFKGVQTFNLSSALTGTFGVETFKFTDGTIYTVPTIFNFTADGTASNDIIYGTARSIDTINGLDGNDTLYGFNYDDILNGGAGTDILYGGSENDILIGGTGNDTLYGEAGNDTYKYNSGDGLDTIVNSGGIDTIVLGNGFTKTDLTFQKSGNNLLVFLKGIQTFIIQNHFISGQAVEAIKFSDGTTYLLNEIVVTLNGTSATETLTGSDGANDSIFGFAGNDTLFGKAGADTLNGGVGQDTMDGGVGDDIYTFAVGDSAISTPDRINLTQGEGSDSIKLTGGILPQNVQFWQDSYSTGLYHLRYSPTDEVLIQGWKRTSSSSMSGVDHTIGKIIFDNGTVWDFSSGLTLTDTDEAHYMNATAGNDTLYGRGGNDTIRGNAGNDIISGGIGSDNLYGGAGDDIYVFAPGDSLNATPDQINDIVGEGVDTIKLTGGILPQNVTLFQDNAGRLVIQYSPTEKVLLQGWTPANSSGVSSGTSHAAEKIVFDNGTVWDISQGLTLTDSDVANSIYGTKYSDIIKGNGGNDSINGYEGNDTLYGGLGNDTIYDLSGSDIIFGNEGNDIIYGSSGLFASNNGIADHDLIDGGTGKDELYGSWGDDTYVFRAGDSSASNPDFIYEVINQGNDTIKLTGGVLPQNVAFTKLTSDYWYTLKFGTDEIRIVNYVYDGTYMKSNNTLSVEKLVFDNGIVLNLSNILNGTNPSNYTPTAGNDTIDMSAASSGVNINLLAGNDTFTGSNYNDVIYGGDGIDRLYGNVGSDTLYGDAGNDFLYGGAGADMLFGGAGVDTFVFSRDSAFNGLDTISGMENLDKIDISQVLQGYDPLTSAIANFVEITTVGPNSILKVDYDGGANNFVQIATIVGLTGLTDEAALVASGNLIVK